MTFIAMAMLVFMEMDGIGNCLLIDQGSSLKKETPKAKLGGKRKAVFGGMPVYDGWAYRFEATQPATRGLSGFGGAQSCL